MKSPQEEKNKFGEKKGKTKKRKQKEKIEKRGGGKKRENQPPTFTIIFY